MIRSQLGNKANKLNKPKGTKCKDFWNYCRPYFSNKNFKSTESILLLENDKVISNEVEVANSINTHFTNITKTLKTYQWNDQNDSKFKIVPLDFAISKFKTHPSINSII